MHVYVDSREPPNKMEFLTRAFPNHTFERIKLDEGDFQSDSVLVERKTIADLYGSIVGTKNKKGRFEDQILRLGCHDKIVLLMITGDLFEFIDNMKKRGTTINTAIFYGAISSVSCRENIHVWWIEKEWNALAAMVLFMQKIEEGNYNIPSRRDPDILMARYLRLTLTQWKQVKKEYSSFVDLINATEKDLMKIRGIGKVKAKGIKEIAGSCW